MKLVYGTLNSSKVNSMKEMLSGLELEIKGLKDIEIDICEPEETGDDPLTNAQIKAKSYYNQIKKPVFSCDTGLYFRDVSSNDQPGVYVKRIHGLNLHGREYVDYYSRLASKYGGKLTAYYKNAICLVLDENTVISYDGEDINSEEFYIVESVHENFKEGYPLDSLSVEIKSEKYYYDMETKLQDNGMILGFRKFFTENVDMIK